MPLLADANGSGPADLAAVREARAQADEISRGIVAQQLGKMADSGEVVVRNSEAQAIREEARHTGEVAVITPGQPVPEGEKIQMGPNPLGMPGESPDGWSNRQQADIIAGRLPDGEQPAAVAAPEQEHVA